MLYVTGGLVLGETIALWMTVEQVCAGLAAMLLVLVCVCLRGRFRVKGIGKNGRRLPVFFSYLIVVWLGLVSGAVRMEYEEWIFKTEQEMILEKESFDVWMTGQAVEIKTVNKGVQLLLSGCEWTEETGDKKRIRKMYVYADAIEELHLGMSVTVQGICKFPEPDRNPGEFDYRKYCLAKGVTGIFYADYVFSIQMDDKASNYVTFIKRGYWKVREMIRQTGLMFEQKLEQIAEPEDLGILKAVLLGQKADLDEDLYELYRKNGIAHVLAISGLHVSVIGMGLWKGLRRAGLGYLSSGSIAFLVLFAYGVMTGFGPSVVRSVFMMGLSFCAGALGRTYDLPSAMCIPAMGILLWNPYMLTQASFQLSFLAVLAMFVPGSVLARRWEWEGPLETVWISISLQIITLPFVLVHSYEIPVLGILLNLLAVPLMSYVLISGIMGTLGGFLWNGFGIVLLGGAHVILELYQEICLRIQQIPCSNWILGVPPIWKIIGYYGLILCGTYFGFRCGKRWLFLWGIAVLLLVSRPHRGLSVTFLDVGQGDSIFLKAGNRTMLVDCGSSQKQEIGTDVLIPFLKSQGVRKLDTVVVTHGDQDHVSGIRELLKDMECGIMIGQIIVSEAGREDTVCQELVRIAEERNISVSFCKAGDRLTGLLGDSIEILCLNPKDSTGSEQSILTDRNGDSVVLYVSYESFSMLLTGDIGTDEEMELMNRYDLPHITVLKAAHHGSAYSNSRALLERLDPSYVIFSYGIGNSYGHPSPGVVDICKELGAYVCETAKSGAVQIWTDGTSLRIEGWLDRKDGI